MVATSPFHIASAANTNATVIKASAGTLWGVSVSNSNASSWRSVKFYDKATTPVPGTDVPILAFSVPPYSVRDIILPAAGVAFATGIGVALVQGAEDLSSVAVGAAEVVLDVFFG